MKQQYTTQMANELVSCTNLEQYLQVLKKYYDTEGTNLGIITKKVLISKTGDLIKATGAKPRKQFV
jgi:hypothetical protein